MKHAATQTAARATPSAAGFVPLQHRRIRRAHHMRPPTSKPRNRHFCDCCKVSRSWQTLYNESQLAMKASLQLRLSQHLALTPQLQQSIRLLQLSTLELQQEVSMAIAQNPLLENEDDWIASPLRVAADGSLIAQAPNSSA